METLSSEMVFVVEPIQVLLTYVVIGVIALTLIAIGFGLGTVLHRQ
jgi:putative Mn2+ efflux pump MntP